MSLTVVWKKWFSHANHDIKLYTLQADANENVYACGSTDGPLVYGEISSVVFPSDAAYPRNFLVKLNPEGVLQWVMYTNSVVHTIRVDSKTWEPNIYLSGYTTGTHFNMSVYDANATRVNEYSAPISISTSGAVGYLIKFSQINYETLVQYDWMVTCDTDLAEESRVGVGEGVHVTSDEILWTRTLKNRNTIRNKTSSRRIRKPIEGPCAFIARISELGIVKKVTAYSHGDDNYGYAISAADSHVYVAGSSTSSGAVHVGDIFTNVSLSGIPPSGVDFIYILRLNMSDLTVANHKIYTGIRKNGGMKMCTFKNDDGIWNVHLLASFANAENSNLSRLSVLSFGENLEDVWTIYITSGSGGSDVPLDIGVSYPTGDVLAAGYTESDETVDSPLHIDGSNVDTPTNVSIAVRGGSNKKGYIIRMTSSGSYLCTNFVSDSLFRIAASSSGNGRNVQLLGQTSSNVVIDDTAITKPNIANTSSYIMTLAYPLPSVEFAEIMTASSIIVSVHIDPYIGEVSNIFFRYRLRVENNWIERETPPREESQDLYVYSLTDLIENAYYVVEVRATSRIGTRTTQKTLKTDFVAIEPPTGLVRAPDVSVAMGDRIGDMGDSVVLMCDRHPKDELLQKSGWSLLYAFDVYDIGIQQLNGGPDGSPIIGERVRFTTNQNGFCDGTEHIDAILQNNADVGEKAYSYSYSTLTPVTKYFARCYIDLRSGSSNITSSYSDPIEFETSHPAAYMFRATKNSISIQWFSRVGLSHTVELCLSENFSENVQAPSSPVTITVINDPKGAWWSSRLRMDATFDALLEDTEYFVRLHTHDDVEETYLGSKMSRYSTSKLYHAYTVQNKELSVNQDIPQIAQTRAFYKDVSIFSKNLFQIPPTWYGYFRHEKIISYTWNSTTINNPSVIEMLKGRLRILSGTEQYMTKNEGKLLISGESLRSVLFMPHDNFVGTVSIYFDTVIQRHLWKNIPLPVNGLTIGNELQIHVMPKIRVSRGVLFQNSIQVLFPELNTYRVRRVRNTWLETLDDYKFPSVGGGTYEDTETDEYSVNDALVLDRADYARVTIDQNGQISCLVSENITDRVVDLSLEIEAKDFDGAMRERKRYYQRIPIRFFISPSPHILTSSPISIKSKRNATVRINAGTGVDHKMYPEGPIVVRRFSVGDDQFDIQIPTPFSNFLGSFDYDEDESIGKTMLLQNNFVTTLPSLPSGTIITMDTWGGFSTWTTSTNTFSFPLSIPIATRGYDDDTEILDMRDCINGWGGTILLSRITFDGAFLGGQRALHISEGTHHRHEYFTRKFVDTLAYTCTYADGRILSLFFELVPTWYGNVRMYKCHFTIKLNNGANLTILSAQNQLLLTISDILIRQVNLPQYCTTFSGNLARPWDLTLTNLSLLNRVLPANDSRTRHHFPVGVNVLNVAPNGEIQFKFLKQYSRQTLSLVAKFTCSFSGDTTNVPITVTLPPYKNVVRFAKMHETPCSCSC
jgi:hypothetical protein